MAGQGLRVFISYARRDGAAFAEELLAGLELLGFDPFLDRHDIAAGEDWEQRLGGLIQSSDTVVFVMTPGAVTSDRCAWEVQTAKTLSKRILPVVAIEVAEADTPADLRRLNYIFFAGRSFMASLGELSKALQIDVEWIREHTRLSELAGRWRDREKAEALLLRGSELQGAKTWLAAWKAPAPEPTDLHREFIGHSEAVELDRFSAERQRLDEIAAAQAERGRALARTKRTIIVSGALVAVFLVATGAAAFVVQQTNAQLEISRKQVKVAEENNKKTQDRLARSDFDLRLSLGDIATRRGNILASASRIAAVASAPSLGGAAARAELTTISETLRAEASRTPASYERQLSAHFKAADFLASDLALRLGSDNTPDPEVADNLRDTAQKLERVRSLLNCPIQIISGYRSEELNKAVGSTSKTSHRTGRGLDFSCPGYGTPYEIAKRIAADASIMNDVDQLILEYGRWVHISFDPKRRKQVFTLHYFPDRGSQSFTTQGIIPLDRDSRPIAR